MRMLQRQLSMAFLKWRDAAAELKKCAGLGGVRNDTWPRRRSSNDDVSPASIASVRTYIGKIRHSDTKHVEQVFKTHSKQPAASVHERAAGNRCNNRTTATTQTDCR